MGKIVAFSGVDGSGKTTLAKLLVKYLKDSGYDAKYHHELNFLFITKIFYLLTFFRGRNANNILKGHILGSVENNKPIFFEGYHLLFWLDRFVTHILFRLRKCMTILDRCQYDFIARFDYQRSRNNIIKKIFTLLPRQDVIILFSISPQSAYSRVRKREKIDPENRPLEYYVNIEKLLRFNSRKYGYEGEVDAEEPVEKVLGNIVKILKEKKIIA